MNTKNYKRADSEEFAKKVSKKIAGWYNNDANHEKAVDRIVRQREEIYSLLENVEKVSTAKLLKYLDSSGFFYRPSSAKAHHNFPCGLAEHSLGVFRIVEEWNKMTPEERKKSDMYNLPSRYPWKNQKVYCDILTEKMNYDDMVIAGICHDLCKAKHYYFDGRIIKSHNSDPELNSAHSRLSVERLEKNGINTKNCDEILLAVENHMRLFDHYESARRREGKHSMLAIAVWAADKLDASRHPAGKLHRDKNKCNNIGAMKQEQHYLRNEFTPAQINELKENQIFVFGSNLTGRHGGGAARFAFDHFGADWGVGVGRTGQCYAIPTMHGGVNEIRPYVDEFIAYAAAHPELEFLVTPVGCGIAGFTEAQMAPLFADALPYVNILLPKGFVKVLDPGQ